MREGRSRPWWPLVVAVGLITLAALADRRLVPPAEAFAEAPEQRAVPLAGGLVVRPLRIGGV